MEGSSILGKLLQDIREEQICIPTQINYGKEGGKTRRRCPDVDSSCARVYFPWLFLAPFQGLNLHANEPGANIALLGPIEPRQQQPPSLSCVETSLLSPEVLRYCRRDSLAQTVTPA